MLAALAEELRPLAAELEPLGQALSAGDEEAAAKYLGLLERLANVGELLELPALGELTLHMLANVPAQLGDLDQQELAAYWPGHLAKALGQPEAQENQDALVHCLSDPRWPEPMDRDRAHELLQEILQCDQQDLLPQREPRLFEEHELSLAIQAELTPEMRAAFAHEAPKQAESLNQTLALLSVNNADVEIINTARRVAHTLKGSAALLGVRAVVNLTHLLEEVLGLLQEHPHLLNQDLSDDLQEAGDNLEEMIECLLGQGEEPVGIGSIIQRIDSWAVQVDRMIHGIEEPMPIANSGPLPAPKPAAGTPTADSVGVGHSVATPPPPVEPASEAAPLTPVSPQESPVPNALDLTPDSASQSTPPDVVESLLDDDGLVPPEANNDSQAMVPQINAAPASPEKKPAPKVTPQADEVETSLTVPVRVVDDMLRSIGELMVQVGHLQNQLRNNVERSSSLSQQLLAMQEAIHELESHVDLHGTPALQAVANAGQELFDPLELDQYNLLHSLSRSFAESALDAREMSRELHDALLGMQNQLLQQQRLGREVNNSVLAARMVRVSGMTSRWQRIVRQACRATGKQAELVVIGGDIAIDTDILNGLVEPLLHMLRNAVDHGIESEAERLAMGKAAKGHIQLRFTQDGNRIQVTLIDDGRGLDFSAIEERAHALGLVQSGHNPTIQELQQWVLLPGFTTRDEVSEVSGRGIGLDAVRAAVQQLGGTVTLSSKAGQGLSMRLVLPQSLSSTHLLFVQVGDFMYGLPSLGIQQILFSDSGYVEKIGERWIFRFGDRERPLYRLADLIGMGGEAQLEELDPPKPIILIERGEEHIAILVDAVIDSRESVVKSLKTHFPAIHGASGASILADGGLAIVLDMAEIQPSAAVQTQKLVRRIPTQKTRQQSLPRVLVVDDSLSARRSVSRFMQDLGYQVDSALDGIEAVERIEEAVPDIVLADLEMPRMNGLELAAHIRSRAELQHLPVIMITSRSTEKHRQQAQKAGVSTYLTKPYQEQELADLVQDYLRSTKQRSA
jgi:chemosensory pili system protein ChpA (sensor histidine kinase/response regulator)